MLTIRTYLANFCKYKKADRYALLADPNNIKNPIFAYFWSLELGFGLT